MMKLVLLVAKIALRVGASGDAVKLLQTLLRLAGHEIVIDGVFGNITKEAVKAFQTANRIAADGLVGPITAAFLDALKPNKPALPEKPLPSALAVAPWLAQMRAWTGQKEIPGARSNPLILSWVAALGAKYPTLKPNVDWYANDDTPWCGLACAAAVGLSEPGYKPPDAPLYALNWADSPAMRELKEPALGCVMVKKRKGGGHVTLYEGESGNSYFCRGGNQSNRINVAKFSKSEQWWFRWPLAAAVPTTGRVKTSFADVPSNPTLA